LSEVGISEKALYFARTSMRSSVSRAAPTDVTKSGVEFTLGGRPGSSGALSFLKIDMVVVDPTKG
jgi:hypothetical protein